MHATRLIPIISLAAVLLMLTGCGWLQSSAPRDGLAAAVAHSETEVADLRADLVDAEAARVSAQEIADGLPADSDAGRIAREIADAAQATVARLSAELADAEPALAALRVRLAEIDASAAERGDVAANIEAASATLTATGTALGGPLGAALGGLGTLGLVVAGAVARRSKRQRSDYLASLRASEDRRIADVGRVVRALDRVAADADVPREKVETELDLETTALFRAVRGKVPNAERAAAAAAAYA